MRAGEEDIRRALGDSNESVRLAALEALGIPPVDAASARAAARRRSRQ
jgi:hypothetical protein